MDSVKPKVDVYEIVTNRIIELLESGTVPWKKPWNDSGIPMNVISKRKYRGINVWLLLALNYPQNLFLTWDQLKKIGGSVKQGEHGHVVAFWKIKPKSENEEEKHQPLLRYYKVFNVDQCKDLPLDLIVPFVAKDHDPIAECEKIITQMPDPPNISYKGKDAFYDIQADLVNVPKLKTFTTAETYYATLFHELVHSTGHEKRLNRKTIITMAEYGSDIYGAEELVAELGSAYICCLSGILNSEIECSAAYIDGWLTALRKDKRFILLGSGKSQQAVDFILNFDSNTAKNEANQKDL